MWRQQDGPMGFGLPAAIGAAVAYPDRPVVCITGDGSIQMNMQEMMTADDLGLNVKVAIFKNGYLGMVRQWQQLFLGKRYSSVKISSPDFVALAKSFGAHGFRARTMDEAEQMIDLALHTDGLVIMEFDITEETNVYPIVPPGLSNQDMIVE
ncbi:thiamine pyrophosphate-dependent acetolactate synthase large subunit-like protein [Paenibacillus sp. PastF-1]|nr:thiamine pyrophosphate-dependent acetolactate synthase large subunit-like protein [Paenibacillus sp. PastF-2]MDF9845912.1 thiamine pyrophosphate-dependent acetolactate synthase large subunit-like protein [Paenibacillus sp. PastM-2]MDF9852485.1 thiamine pyrophosphate-dependent acetolactate synthase large subunit-like protein [Paenibacillus sp. PastF-1]MDH6477785.1 thiamine pyrophosphate-dependent acetolactate synthase large subunit-like protein [Paenibacillus sp. PastH-2]MDH6505524.1 thiamine